MTSKKTKMPEQKQEQKIQVDIKRVIPLFADGALIANIIKTSKDGKQKEGHVTLIFIDNISQQPVARIVVSKQTAEEIHRNLSDILVKLDKELKSKKKIKPKIELAKPKKTGRYVG